MAVSRLTGTRDTRVLELTLGPPPSTPGSTRGYPKASLGGPIASEQQQNKINVFKVCQAFRPVAFRPAGETQSITEINLPSENTKETFMFIVFHGQSDARVHLQCW